jgi:hypothetical protein
MIIIHLFFFDEGGLFVGKKKDEQNWVRCYWPWKR